MKTKTIDMKKLLISLLSLVFVAATAMAQSPVHVGLKLGANYSNMNASLSSVKTENAAGYLGGLFVRFDLPKKIIIQPEVYYSLKKSSFKYPSFNAQGQEIERKDDIEKGDLDIVILLGYKLVDLELFNLRVMAGAVNSNNINDNLPVGYTDFEKSSWGYQAGLGVDITKFTVDLRYEGSFGEIADKIKYQGYQLAIGFKFI